MDKDKLAKDILREGRFKGTIKIHTAKAADFLPKKYPGCNTPISYILDCGYELYTAVLIQGDNKLILFNPTPFIGPTLKELLNDLSSVYCINTITAEFPIHLKLVWSACVYFIHIFNNDPFSYDLLRMYFPKDTTAEEHTNNILDFIKCKSPTYGNSLITKVKLK